MSDTLRSLAQEIVGQIQTMKGGDAVDFVEGKLRGFRPEFALVPIDVDTGEMDSPIGVVPLTLADINDGMTFVGVSEDTPEDEIQALVDRLHDASERARNPVLFIIGHGHIGVKYQMLRAIHREVYDEEFGERKPVAG